MCLSYDGTQFNEVFTSEDQIIRAPLFEGLKSRSSVRSRCGVKPLSSIFDVPAQLMLVLSLAASGAETEVKGPRQVATSANVITTAVRSTQRLQGPYRFGANIWLHALKDAPDADGLSALSRRIFRTSSGRLYVPVAAERRQILDARFDRAIASRIARAFAERNARLLRPAIGRKVNAADLYIAHLFGPKGAIKLIKLAMEKPGARAVNHAPQLARALPEAFYRRATPLTLGDVYGRLTRPLRDFESEMGHVSIARAQR